MSELSDSLNAARDLAAPDGDVASPGEVAGFRSCCSLRSSRFTPTR